jgi:hypothetical protein
MDGQKPPISPSAFCGRIGADAVPADSAGESSSVVYFGRAQQVSEGFAIALRAMEFEVMGFEVMGFEVMEFEVTGFEPGIPPSLAQYDTTSNPEDS